MHEISSSLPSRQVKRFCHWLEESARSCSTAGLCSVPVARPRWSTLAFARRVLAPGGGKPDRSSSRRPRLRLTRDPGLLIRVHFVPTPAPTAVRVPTSRKRSLLIKNEKRLQRAFFSGLRSPRCQERTRRNPGCDSRNGQQTHPFGRLGDG